jgi:holliday junction DNA helicase RuvB
MQARKGATMSEVNDVSTSSLAHLIGQRGVIAQVQVALEAAWADKRKFDSALLVGGPGLGKSQLAKVISAEMAADLHEVLGQSITSAADLNALLLSAKDKDVVHLDEAHELDKQFQTALYLATDQKRIVLQGGRAGRAPQSIPLADFTLLLSTTDEHSLLQPLRDRMRLTLRFQFYSDEELVELLRQRCRALRWRVDETILPQIAQRSRGTPRLALRLLQACRRVCRAEGQTAVTAGHFLRACGLEEIDDLGLGPTEQQYLALVAEGTSRLGVIASRLGLPSRTVSHVVEPFLLRAGLVMKGDGSRRELTALGRERLAALRQRLA